MPNATGESEIGLVKAPYSQSGSFAGGLEWIIQVYSPMKVGGATWRTIVVQAMGDLAAVAAGSTV